MPDTAATKTIGLTEVDLNALRFTYVLGKAIYNIEPKEQVRRDKLGI
jgi:predicted Zn-dependent protease